jgi:hypothetical protein
MRIMGLGAQKIDIMQPIYEQIFQSRHAPSRLTAGSQADRRSENYPYMGILSPGSVISAAAVALTTSGIRRWSHPRHRRVAAGFERAICARSLMSRRRWLGASGSDWLPI